MSEHCSQVRALRGGSCIYPRAPPPRTFALQPDTAIRAANSLCNSYGNPIPRQAILERVHYESEDVALGASISVFHFCDSARRAIGGANSIDNIDNDVRRHNK